MEAFSGSDLRDAATKYGNADDATPVGRADVCDASAVLLAAAVLPSDAGPDSVPDRPARAKALLCADAGAAAGPDHEPAVLRADVGANAPARRPQLRADFGAIAPRSLVLAHKIADPGAHRKANPCAVIQADTTADTDGETDIGQPCAVG